MSLVGAINLFRLREKLDRKTRNRECRGEILMNRDPFKATASALIVLALLFGSAGKGTGAKSQIVAESPDGKFGFRDYEDGRVDLVALPSRKSVLKLGAFGQIEV